MTVIEEKVRQSLNGKGYLKAKNISQASSRSLDLAETIVRETA